jgi:hypothetical protein
MPKDRDSTGRDLTLKRTAKRWKGEKFASIYVQNGLNNAKKALIEAGYSKHTSSTRLLQDEDIKQEIEWQLDIVRSQYHTAREQKIDFLNDLIMRSFRGECSPDKSTVNAGAVLGAINILNKMQGHDAPPHYLSATHKTLPYAHSTTDVRRLILEQENQLKERLSLSIEGETSEE